MLDVSEVALALARECENVDTLLCVSAFEVQTLANKFQVLASFSFLRLFELLPSANTAIYLPDGPALFQVSSLERTRTQIKIRIPRPHPAYVDKEWLQYHQNIIFLPLRYSPSRYWA